MTPEDAFLAAIRDEPDADLHRLAYADWLAEQDDPAQRDRGDFIRAQCQLARLRPRAPGRSGLVAREADLLDRHHARWADAPFLDWLHHRGRTCHNPRGHRFCQLLARGLAARLDRDALPEGDPARPRLERAIARAGKTMEDEFGYYPDTCTAPLFEAPVFRRGLLEEATVEDYLVPLFAEAIFAIGLVRRLTIEDLDGESERGDEVIEGLLRAMTRPQLEVLDIEPTPTDPQAVADLVASPHLARLRELTLWVPGEHEQIVAALAAAPHLRHLRELSLWSMEDFGDDELRLILESPHLAGLKELTLESARFSPSMRKRYRARFRH